MGARTNQASQESATDSIKTEDETLTSAVSTVAIPLVMGEAKTTVRWMTPIFGQRVVKVQAKRSGKKG